MDFFKDWKIAADDAPKQGAQTYAEEALSLQLSHPDLAALFKISSLLLGSKLDVDPENKEIWDDFSLLQKNHFRNAICFLVEFFIQKGLFTEKEGKSISYAGLSNSFANLYNKNELPSIVITEMTRTGYFSIVKTSRTRRDTSFYELNNKENNPANLPKTPSIEEVTELFHRLADEKLNQLWHHLNISTWFSAFKSRLKIPEGSHLTIKEVEDKVKEEINKEANHPITAAQKQQLFNDITSINSNLSKKADTSNLNALSSKLYFQDGLNRLMYLDSMKQFFFQRGVLKNSELEMFYQEALAMPKTVFAQFKLNPASLWFDQQVHFNLMPKLNGQDLVPPAAAGVSLAKLNEEMEHVYHLIGWHALYNQHFNDNDMNVEKYKVQNDFWGRYLSNNKSIRVRNNNDWLNEAGDYSIEYLFELERSSREINLNTIMFGVDSGLLSGWRFAWWYVGMGTWGSWSSTSGNEVGSGWFKFDEKTTFKLNLKITLSKNSDGTRNYLLILTGQNQKGNNFVKFRSKKYLPNQAAAQYIHSINLQLNQGTASNQFSKPKHMNIKILEQIHH